MTLENFCLVLDDFLDPSLIDEAYSSINKKDFDPFFVKKCEVDSEKNYLYKIIHQTWIEKLKFSQEKIVGFEVWCNLMDPNNILDLHCDVDEFTEQLTGRTVHPMYTSVLYLGPKNGLAGGSLRLNLKYDSTEIKTSKEIQSELCEEGEQEGKSNQDWLTIPFKYNRLVVFDPKRPHLITKIKDGATAELPRIGLTMAVWDYELTILE
mgnify:FL=1